MKILNKIRALFKPKEQPKELPKVQEKDYWADARSTHETLKKGWDAAAQASQLPLIHLNEIYRSASGNIYYTFIDPSALTLSRLRYIEKAVIHIENALDADYLRAWNQQLDNAIRSKDIERIALLHSDFKLRTSEKTKDNAYLELACLYLLRHDENPYTFDPTSHKRKKEEVAQDPELYTFFLNFAWGVVQQDTQ